MEKDNQTCQMSFFSSITIPDDPIKKTTEEVQEFYPEEKAYGIKILDELFFRRSYGMNISQMLALFNNQKKEKVRQAITKLVDAQLIIAMEERRKASSQEKRYILSEAGAKIVLNFYNKP